VNKLVTSRRSLWLGTLVAACTLGAAGVAQAQPPKDYWTCQAHAATVNIGGPSGLTLDPLHANTNPSDGACHDDGATVPAAAANDILGPNTLSVDSGNTQAQTGLTNGGSPSGNPPPSPPYLQAPAAVAQVDNSDINLGGGALHITAKAVRSYVSGFCAFNGAGGLNPVLESGNPLYPSGRFPDGSQVGGQVVDLRINGTSILGDGQPDAALTQLFQGLSPLAPLIKVSLNQTYSGVDPATGEVYLRREAVRIELLNGGSGPAITIVLGSATVDYKDGVCTLPPGVVTNGPTGSPTAAGPTFGPGGNEPGSNGGGTSLVTTTTGPSGTTIIQASSRTPNGTNASECAHLRMWYDPERTGKPNFKGGPESLSIRRGTRHVIRGTVRNCKGQAIVGAKIELVEIVHGVRHLIKTGLRSRAHGRLTMITPNNLTTRTLEFQYRAFIPDTRIAGKARLRLKVHR
jgi:hypothetical protein